MKSSKDYPPAHHLMSVAEGRDRETTKHIKDSFRVPALLTVGSRSITTTTTSHSLYTVQIKRMSFPTEKKKDDTYNETLIWNKTKFDTDQDLNLIPK